MNANNDEGKLISGKEALIALANGEDVLWRTKCDAEVKSMLKNTPCLAIALDENCNYRFWIKPKTLTINGIEVPAPFEPEDGEQFWHLYPSMGRGYNFTVSVDSDHYQQFGAWRTEEEIKQVVAALRQVFGGAV